ncbi:glycosyltransferase family 2 protein [candidate division WOR-3 bacterium]|nr:glycosyltransferase family 2 protein [candidate division WOR-3 bacterium]
MQPKLSVVFINYQSADLLDRAIASLRKAEPVLAPEVIVVDNASPDRPALDAVCARHRIPLVRLSRNRGYGAAANRGFRRARARYVAVANPDLRFEPGGVSRLAGLLDAEPAAGAVGPQLVYPDGRPQPSARRYPGLRYALAGRRSPLARLCPKLAAARDFQYLGTERAADPVEVEALLGTFAVFRREALDSAGGFDERYFMFAEDMELCRRLRQKGWKVFLEPRARVEHYYGGVRRRFRRFTEYHRVKALTQFMSQGRGCLRLPVVVAGAWYYFLLEGMAAVGLQEYEYSWRLREPR